MPSITKIRQSKYNQTCRCGRTILKGDLVGIGNTILCYQCSKKSIVLRLKVLADWKQSKIQMLDRLKAWQNRDETKNEMMLRTIEG